MYTEFYNKIKTIIEAGNLGIAKIDWFNGQYDQHFNDDAAEGFPACYVEFMPMQWQEESDGVEHAEAIIMFHLLTHKLGDDNVAIMTLARAFSNYMRGKSSMTIENTYPIVGPMSKVSTAFVPKGNLKVFKMGVKTVLYDAIPEQYTQDVVGEYILVNDVN